MNLFDHFIYFFMFQIIMHFIKRKAGFGNSEMLFSFCAFLTVGKKNIC